MLIIDWMVREVRAFHDIILAWYEDPNQQFEILLDVRKSTEEIFYPFLENWRIKKHDSTWWGEKMKEHLCEKCNGKLKYVIINFKLLFLLARIA